MTTPMPSLTVRRLSAPDVDDFRLIRLAALDDAPEAFGSTHETEAAWPVSTFAERLETAIVFGAYLDGRIVGMAGFRREPNPKTCHKGFLWGMYVAPEARGRGAGAALISLLLETAAPLVEQVRLSVVTSNRAAIALYERLGFMAYGTEPRALKSTAGYADELLMVRFLREG
jgi:ribosomal protein S18 acetylase RimI-like enzyme